MIRLGVNIDHVATIRNARGGIHPCPVAAALLAEKAGADGITAHLREDRRHIGDADVARLVKELTLPLNLEMAATPEMLAIALKHKPHAACIVPEKRFEVTTEGGLDVVTQQEFLRPFVAALKQAGIRVSLFIDPVETHINAAIALGAPVVELHTGKYCDTTGSARQQELERLQKAAQLAHQAGLECHAGHGLNYDTVGAIAAIPTLAELNIGHFLIGEAIFTGLPTTIAAMKQQMIQARS